MTFSGKLQKLRKDSNLSQEQLASELNVSRQAISKWELGTLPDINNLVKISEFFDCTLDYLMNEEEDKTEEKKVDSFVTHKRKINLRLIFSGTGMTISILSLFILKIFSVINPAPITRQAEDGTWYAGFTGYIDFHNLYEIVNLLFAVFILSFSVFSFYFFRKNFDERFGKEKLFFIAGYIMIMVFCAKMVYEINTKSFVSMNLFEILMSIIYLVCAFFLLLIGNKK